MEATKKAYVDYIKLLCDPCEGPLSNAPYPGIESGYLVREKLELNLPVTNSAALPGANPTGDFMVAVCPAMPFFNTGVTINALNNPFILFGVASNSAALVVHPPCITSDAPAGYDWPPLITNSFVAGDVTATQNGSGFRYRPVACCMKWIPNGQYANRSGTISYIYNPINTLTDTSGTNIGSAPAVLASVLASNAIRSVPNGSENHEICWMPGGADGSFNPGAPGVALTSGAFTSNGAQVTLVGRKIDQTVSGTPGAYKITFDGYIEITTVYEWVPGPRLNIVCPPRKPLSFSLNDVLSKFDPEDIILARSGQHDAGIMPVTKAYSGPSKRYKAMKQ